MGKKSTARAAAVAQYLANAADSVADTRLPGRRPRPALYNPRVETENAYWGEYRIDHLGRKVPNNPGEKTSFGIQVWHTDDDVTEKPKRFEVTVREVKS